MTRAWLVAVAVAVCLLVGEAPAASFAKAELAIPMDDGVSLAATLYLPDGSPPAGGWPGLVVLHGLGRDRLEMNTLVESTGVASRGYAVLTYDARGHGASGGLVGIAGPRDVADAMALHSWLGARPDVAADRIGAWGVSYGGGIALNSLVAGVPWKAVATAATWTSLQAALMPQGLVKSGLAAGLAASIPAERLDPTVGPVLAAALAGNAAVARPWAQERSSLAKLGSVTTPVLLAQARRDFLFGLDQGVLGFQRLQGPKALRVGLTGHAPSTFPAADTGLLASDTLAWLDCQVRTVGCDTLPARVSIAPESFTGQVVRRGTLPPTQPRTFALPGVSTFAQRGKAVRTTARLPQPVEVFGSPTVQATISATGGWSRLVAVLTARTPQGKEIVVASGGVPTRNGTRRLTIQLASQATFVPRGSRFQLTLASSSTAQSPANALYLDLPMRPTARVRVGTAVLRLPVLRTPVTK